MKTAEIEYLENFKTKVFEIAFGKDAINKKFTDSEVLDNLKENSEKRHLFEIMQSALQEEGWDINKGESE